jgi:hypothetical protein
MRMQSRRCAARAGRILLRAADYRAGAFGDKFDVGGEELSTTRQRIRFVAARSRRIGSRNIPPHQRTRGDPARRHVRRHA